MTGIDFMTRAYVIPYEMQVPKKSEARGIRHGPLSSSSPLAAHATPGGTSTEPSWIAIAAGFTLTSSSSAISYALIVRFSSSG